MRDIIKGNGQPYEDLSKRLADNVLESLVDYLTAPGAATSEHVRTISTALQALSVLAVAEQLQQGIAALCTGTQPPASEIGALDALEAWLQQHEPALAYDPDLTTQDALLTALDYRDQGLADLRQHCAALSQQAPDRRQAETDRRQISIIAEWLEEHEPALYHSPTGGGFGELALLAIDRRDRQIDGLQQEIAGLTERLAAAQRDADYYAKVAIQGDGVAP